MNGPQVDINPPTPWRTGFIYDETRGEQRWIFPDLPDWRIDETFAPDTLRFVFAGEGDGWNELRIRCQGTKIRTELNGILVADYEGTGVLDNQVHRENRVGLRGQVALQLHSGDELHMRFKDIQLREL